MGGKRGSKKVTPFKFTIDISMDEFYAIYHTQCIYILMNSLQIYCVINQLSGCTGKMCWSKLYKCIQVSRFQVESPALQLTLLQGHTRTGSAFTYLLMCVSEANLQIVVNTSCYL